MSNSGFISSSDQFNSVQTIITSDGQQVTPDSDGYITINGQLDTIDISGTTPTIIIGNDVRTRVNGSLNAGDTQSVAIALDNKLIRVHVTTLWTAQDFSLVDAFVTKGLASQNGAGVSSFGFYNVGSFLAAQGEFPLVILPVGLDTFDVPFVHMAESGGFFVITFIGSNIPTFFDAFIDIYSL